MSVKCISWVYDQHVGDFTAKAVLAKLADNANDAGVAWPSVETMMQQTEIPRRTLLRKLAWLADAGWISKYQQRAADGRVGRNVYQLAVPWAPGATVAHGPGATDGNQPGATAGASRVRVPSLNRQKATVRDARVRTKPVTIKVNGKAVTADETALAQTVLDGWNAITGQALAAQSWLALIIRRSREHPELGAAEFEHIITATLANPWWDGAPSLNLVFGNDMQFERCIEQTRNGNGNKRRRRYGTGMTTSEILQQAQL